MSSSHRRLAVGLLALALLARPAHADDRSAARQAFREGTRHFEVGDFRSALDAFKRAYLKYEEPAFLFNIGQCQRALGEKSEALRSYRMYLHKLPTSPQRSEVERIVAELQAALEAERSAPPPGDEPPSERETAPSPAPLLVVEAPPSPAPLVIASTPPPRTPLYKKWWLWSAVGLVAVSVGVGVGVAIGLRPGNNTTLPNIGPGSSALRVQP